MAISTAISAQGSTLAIEGTPGAAISITGITLATNAVVTAANSLAVGDVVEFGTVAGMPEILGRLGAVVTVNGTAFTVSIDSSGFAYAGTTGTANPKTWTTIGNVRDFAAFDGAAPEYDKTTILSAAPEYFAGKPEAGQLSANLDIDNADAGQLALRQARVAAQSKAYRLMLPNGNLRVFKALCKKFSEAGGVNAIHKGSVDLRISGLVNFAVGKPIYKGPLSLNGGALTLNSQVIGLAP